MVRLSKIVENTNLSDIPLTEFPCPAKYKKPIPRVKSNKGPLPLQLSSKDIDWLWDASLDFCTFPEMAAALGISVHKLTKSYEPMILEARAKGACNLRKVSKQMAIRGGPGNPAMMVWLQKNYLGMREPERIEQAPQINFHITNRQFGDPNDHKTIEIQDSEDAETTEIC